MKLFIDLDTGKFLVSAGYRNEQSQFEFKRGDSGYLDIAFLRDGVIEDLGSSTMVRFAMKEDGKYDGDYIVYTDSFVVVDGVFYGYPNFNTTELNGLLASGDGDDTNDEDFVILMMEVSWSIDGGVNWLSTNTVKPVVNNDVIKGVEGVPTSAAPGYVTATEVATQIAVVEASVAGSLIRDTNDEVAGDVYFSDAVGMASMDVDGPATVADQDATDPEAVVNFGQGDARYGRVLSAVKPISTTLINSSPVQDVDLTIVDVPAGVYKVEVYLTVSMLSANGAGFAAGFYTSGGVNIRCWAEQHGVNSLLMGRRIQTTGEVEGSANSQSENFFTIIGTIRTTISQDVGVLWGSHSPVSGVYASVANYSSITLTRIGDA